MGMIKCELIVGGYSYRVTDDVMNWDDIVVSVKRGDYDGVVRSFSSKFEFVNSAHALLKKQYRENYLDAAATVVMSRRNNSWKWNELFRCTLDFSTYEDSGNVISINAVDDSLASLIKAKKGTEYEYSVNAVKEENQLYYDGLKMRESVGWKASGDVIDGSKDVLVSIHSDIYSRFFPLYECSIDRSVGRYFVSGSTNDARVNGAPESYMLMATEDGGCDLFVSLSIEVPAGKYLSMELVRMKRDGSKIKLAGASVGMEAPNRKLWLTFGMYIVMSEGDRFFVSYSSQHDFSVRISDDSAFFAGWNSRVRATYLNVVNPTILLNRLLKSMNDGADGLIGEIDVVGNDRLMKCMIVAAESARGINAAKLYSSFDKFADWMEAVFGYVYDISGNRVTFKHREKYFTDDVVKEVVEFDDFSYSVNPSLIYSRVRVGYDKQDYDSVNGRDEFRFTNTFSTGMTLTDNSLDLISSYRADAYGFEFLVQKQGEDTTDTDSDNDVFFVGVELIRKQTVLPGGIATILHQYELVRGREYAISGVISPETMFNAMYSPRSMLLANKGFIGCCTSKLTYTSGEGNSDAVIGGVKEKDDVLISKEERIITVGELSFSTPEFEIPDNQNGLVSLTKNKEKYVGYIQKASMNTGREECTKFTLAVKRIE